MSSRDYTHSSVYHRLTWLSTLYEVIHCELATELMIYFDVLLIPAPLGMISGGISGVNRSSVFSDDDDTFNDVDELDQANK